MVLALQTTLKPGRTGPAVAHPPVSHLTIDVIHTSIDATLVALRKAAWLANRLSARITLHVFQVVPYPLPLESPPVLLDWSERRFHVITEENPIETKVNLYLCRDKEATIQKVLKPDSLVILGGKTRPWW